MGISGCSPVNSGKLFICNGSRIDATDRSFKMKVQLPKNSHKHKGIGSDTPVAGMMTISSDGVNSAYTRVAASTEQLTGKAPVEIENQQHSISFDIDALCNKSGVLNFSFSNGLHMNITATELKALDVLKCTK